MRIKGLPLSAWWHWPELVRYPDGGTRSQLMSALPAFSAPLALLNATAQLAVPKHLVGLATGQIIACRQARHPKVQKHARPPDLTQRSQGFRSVSRRGHFRYHFECEKRHLAPRRDHIRRAESGTPDELATDPGRWTTDIERHAHLFYAWLDSCNSHGREHW